MQNSKLEYLLLIKELKTYDNYCLKRAKGDSIVFADSDDSFKNNSFDNFIKEWNKIPNKFKVTTFAIISRCLGSDGNLGSKLNLKLSLFHMKI